MEMAASPSTAGYSKHLNQLFRGRFSLKGQSQNIPIQINQAQVHFNGPYKTIAAEIDGSNTSFIEIPNIHQYLGQQNFSIAFWFRTEQTYRLFDLAGNRYDGSHGNFFCIRMTGNHESVKPGTISVELDQNNNGLNYSAISSQKSGYNDGLWHHLVFIRDQKIIKLYLDGETSSQTKAPVACILGKHPFKLGRSLDFKVHDKFAGKVTYSNFSFYDYALPNQQIKPLLRRPFGCRTHLENVVLHLPVDYSDVVFEEVGPAGQVSMRTLGPNHSYALFEAPTGQFQRNNFTICFWMRTSSKIRYFDIIGNRSEGSHGNFFCIRMTGKHESIKQGTLIVELDEDQSGKNYVAVSSQKAGCNNSLWHHVVVVRNSINVKLFIDGKYENEGNSNEVTNIKNGRPFKLGRSLEGHDQKFSDVVEYSDLRIYSSALTKEEVENIAFLNE